MGWKSTFGLLLALVISVEFGLLTQAANAQNVTASVSTLQVEQKQLPPRPAATSVASSEPTGSQISAAPKPIKKPAAVKGPYYVDFRARTAVTYGHAFVWYGKTSQKAVEVAGLAPAGDTIPYMLGHLFFVPSETGATYGDLDVQYLTASYRVYLNEADAKKVFAFIKDIQAHSPVWNAETANCTAFLGRIASFMGLKVPFHLLYPEDYVNKLKILNGGRQTIQLAADQ